MAKNKKENPDKLMNRVVKDNVVLMAVGGVIEASKRTILNFKIARESLKADFFNSIEYKNYKSEEILEAARLLGVIEDIYYLQELGMQSQNPNITISNLKKMIKLYTGDINNENFLTFVTVASDIEMSFNRYGEEEDELYNKLYNNNEEVWTREDFKHALDGLINIIESISTYVLVSVMKPKNKLIEDFDINSNGEIKLIYEGKSFLTQDDLSYYYNNSYKKLEERMFGKTYEDWYRKYVYSIIRMRKKINEFNAFGTTKLDTVNVPEKFYFTISRVDYIPTDNGDDNEILSSDDIAAPSLKDFEGKEEVKVNFGMECKTKSISDIIYNKRYAMPSNGCVFKFKEDSAMIDTVEIKEKNNDFYFKITTKEKMFKTIKNKPTSTLYFKITEEFVKEFTLSLENKGLIIDVSDKGSNMLIYSEDRITRNWFEISLKVFAITCLNYIFLDAKENKHFTRYIKESNTNGTHEKLTVYKTAHIRKLPKGFNCSEAAKDRASKFKVKLNEGYTFVREFIPNEGNNKRVILINS